MDALKNYKASPKEVTSLISIISPCIDIQQLRDLVKHEMTTAVNIKNNSNRKSVLAALSKVNTTLSTLRRIPDNGIGIFAGQYI